MNPFAPPAMPAHAAPWIVDRALGPQAVAEAWSTLWYTGLLTGALIGVVALLALDFVIRRAKG